MGPIGSQLLQIHSLRMFDTSQNNQRLHPSTRDSDFCFELQPLALF